jgi:hypothetical protein
MAGKKAEEVAGKSEVDQVPAKVAEGKAAQSRATLHLSGDAFVCALLSSR